MNEPSDFQSKDIEVNKAPAEDATITAYKYRADGSKEIIRFKPVDLGKVLREGKQQLFFCTNEQRNKGSLQKKYPHLNFAIAAIAGRVNRILMGKLQPTYYFGKDAQGNESRLSKNVEDLDEEFQDLITSDTKGFMLALLAALFSYDEDFANNIGTINYKGVKSVIKVDPEYGFNDVEFDWINQTVDDIYEHLAYLYDPMENFKTISAEEKENLNEFTMATMTTYGAHVPEFLLPVLSFNDMQSEEVVSSLLSGKLRNELFLGLAILINSLSFINEAIDKMVPDTERVFKQEFKAIMSARVDKFHQAANRLPNFTQYYEQKLYLEDHLYKLYFIKSKSKTPEEGFEDVSEIKRSKKGK